MVEFSFHLLNEEIKCYFIIDLYFHPGQRKPCNDTIPQAGRESMIFGKPSKKVELYNKISAYFFLKRKKNRTNKPTPKRPKEKNNKKNTLKIHCQWSGLSRKDGIFKQVLQRLYLVNPT